MVIRFDEEAESLKRHFEVQMPSVDAVYSIPDAAVDALRVAVVESASSFLRKMLEGPQGQELCRLIAAIALESQTSAPAAASA